MSVFMDKNFNSIKVRLEPDILSPLIGALGFQFHKGTIRTELPNFSSGAIYKISIP